MLSDARIDELSAGALVEMGTRPRVAALDAVGRAIRAAVAEAVAAEQAAVPELQELEDLRSKLDCHHVRLVCTAARGHPAWKAWQVVASHEDGEQFFPTDETALGAIRAAIRARGEEQ